MKATVSRDYRWWVACHGDPDVAYNNYILDKPFEVLQATERRGEAGYQLQDCDRVVHPFVPAEFVTISEA